MKKVPLSDFRLEGVYENMKMITVLSRPLQ